MDVQYEIKNEKLKKMVENKADQLKISVNQLISNYINRGLMGDNCNEDTFKKLHSEKFLIEINEALDVDWNVFDDLLMSLITHFLFFVTNFSH